MFKPIAAKLAGLGAVAALATAVTASPASALVVLPCYKSGPQITVSPGLELLKVSGTCFTPGGYVDLEASDFDSSTTDWITASASGTFSMSTYYLHYVGAPETVSAFDWDTQHTSNTITVGEPWIG